MLRSLIMWNFYIKNYQRYVDVLEVSDTTKLKIMKISKSAQKKKKTISLNKFILIDL